MKKGQITLFVVMGIVLLLLIGLFFYVRSTLLSQKPQTTDNLPDYTAQIKQFTESCLYKISKEAIIKIGEHGGYINPQEFGIIPVPIFPTKGNSFEFSEGSGLTIPYWYYMSSPDSCINGCNFDSKKPSLSGTSASSIESQIEQYVKTNINLCLDNFKNLGNKDWNVVQSDNMNVDVAIGEERVVVNFDNEIVLSNSNSVSKINKFSTSLNVKLKEMYDIAGEIIHFESDNNTKFLEAITKEVIAVGSIGNNKLLPPIRGLPKMNDRDDFWLLNDVKSSLESFLMTNIPTLQVLFSKNSAVFSTSDPYIDATYNNRIIPLDVELAPPVILNQLNINFVYLGWWPTYLKIKPGGQLIKPDFVGLDTSFFTFGVSIYNFAYDVSYPVLITIDDPDAFSGEGFTLQFGVEANLRNNQPVKSEPFIFNKPEENITLIDFCDFGQMNSGNITIYTYDELNGENVDNVDVTYKCFDESCLLGKTYLSGAGKAELTTKLPSCLGGYFKASKLGYSTAITPFSTNLDVSENVNISLVKEKKFNLTFKKNLLQKVSIGFDYAWNLLESSSSIDDDEQIFLTLTKVVSQGTEEYIKFVEIKGSNTSTIDLVPGNYTVEAIIIKNFGPDSTPEKIVIPTTTIEDVTIPEIIINSTFLEGGLLFDVNHTFEITLDDYNKDELIFHLVALDTGFISTANDLQQMDAYVDYSVSARDILKPEFKTNN